MSDCQHPCCNGTCTNPRHRCANATPNPAALGTRLCGLHLRGLHADIDDIARVTALIDTMHDALLDTQGSGDGVRAVPASKPPMRLDLVAVLTGQTAERITGWAADIVSTSRALSVAEAGRILALNVDAIACHPVVADIAVELRQAAADCRAVVADPRWNTEDQDKRDTPVGRCTQPDPVDMERACRGDLHWIRNTMATRCHRCGHEQQPDGWLPKRLILGPFGLERRTLDRWIERGLVAYINRLVCVDDVRAVIKTRLDGTGHA